MKGDNKRKEIRWTFDGDCIRCLSHFHDKEGYPFLTRNGHRMKLGRHILFKKHGTQPDHIFTRHTCDNSWCINPDHILIGTHRDNMDDMVTRRRSQIGERHWNARLSEGKIRKIRNLIGVLTQQEIADVFGISRPYVANIKSGRARAKETIRTIE